MLDDKIDLNRKMNATLDEIARTLFRSWFVDFDPVCAKAEGHQPEGMDAETAALFPDRFVDSELGPIPEGWEVRSLDEIATFLNGLALQKFPPQGNDADLPVIKIAQLKKGTAEGAGLASSDVPMPYIVDDGDVLFSWSGSLEAVIWGGGKGALNQHLFKVTSDVYPRWFYYYWIHQHLAEFRTIAAGKATTMGHIQRRHLTDAEVLCPSPVLLKRLDAILSPLVALISANLQGCRTLVEVRDALLPELLSGRLRIPELGPHELCRPFVRLAHGLA
jgi:type I restriction enzyme S subunit